MASKKPRMLLEERQTRVCTLSKRWVRCRLWIWKVLGELCVLSFLVRASTQNLLTFVLLLPNHCSSLDKNFWIMSFLVWIFILSLNVTLRKFLNCSSYKMRVDIIFWRTREIMYKVLDKIDAECFDKEVVTFFPFLNFMSSIWKC